MPSAAAIRAGEVHWADKRIELPYLSELKPIYHLFARPYFSRLWIWQEFRLANHHSVVVCGLKTLRLPDFQKAVCTLQIKTMTRAARDDFGNELGPHIEKLQFIFDLCESSAPRWFTSLIAQTARSQCQDPRDRIYALLSMLRGREQEMKIIPDYRKSVEEVYQDFFTRYTGDFTYTNLNLLSSCELQETRLKMPSWVPDWSLSRSAVIFSHSLATGESFSDVHFEGGTLQTMGVKVTTIECARKGMPPGDRDHRDTIAAIRRLAPPEQGDGGANFDLFCRTLIREYLLEKWDPPSPHWPTWAESVETIRAYVKNLDPDSVPAASLRTPWTVMSTIIDSLAGRCFFMTLDGRFGLGTQLACPGDDVVVFPGCSSPMLLRPINNGAKRYQVVGECYIPDLVNNEALLGSLSEEFECIAKFNEKDGSWYRAYRNMASGRTQWIDPRLDIPSDEYGMEPKAGRRLRMIKLGKESGGTGCVVPMKTAAVDGEDVLVVVYGMQQFNII